MSTTYEHHARAPIALHLDAYRAHLLGKGDTARHVRLTASRIGKVMAGCFFATLADLDAAAVSAWLAGRAATSTSTAAGRRLVIDPRGSV